MRQKSQGSLGITKRQRQIPKVSELVESGSCVSGLTCTQTERMYSLQTEREHSTNRLIHLSFSQLLRLQTPSPEPVLPMPALPQVLTYVYPV